MERFFRIFREYSPPPKGEWVFLLHLGIRILIRSATFSAFKAYVGEGDGLSQDIGLGGATVIIGGEKFAKGLLGGLTGQGGVYAPCEPHSAVAPSKTGYCMVPTEIMHAQTAGAAEGVSPFRNWMLSRTGVEVRRGAGVP